jgi:ribosomal protein L16 Arg81 hydroxylase
MDNQIFELETLISPWSIDTFLSEYWEQRPLIVSREKPDYYSSLFSIQDVESVISSRRSDASSIGVFNKSKLYFQLPTDRNSNDNHSINEMYDAYSKGNTISLNNLQFSCQPLSSFCRSLELFFNYSANISSYLTPKKSQGVLPHYDTHDVFILQIDGAKLWRVYDSFLCLPLEEHRELVSAEKIGNPIHEVRLAAGDLLYIPRGYVHEALTSECSSLHLTVGIHPFRLADLVDSAIALASRQHVSLRKSLPIGFLNNRDIETSLKHQLKELLELLSDNTRIEEAVEHLAKQFVAQMVPLSDGHFAQLNDVDSIDLETIVKKRNGMFCYIFKEDDAIVIQFPGNVVKGPIYIESALYFIADAREFSVKSIPGSLSNNGKLALVCRLVREGLLTCVRKD